MPKNRLSPLCSSHAAGTTTTYHQLICGGDPSCEVIRRWCYGPCRLRVNDDDDMLIY